MLVNDECSYWRYGVGDFLLVCDRSKSLHGDGLACEISQTNPTPEYEVSNTDCYGG